MNILLVSQMGVNSPTGVTTYYKTLRDYYSKRGYKVLIITPSDISGIILFFIKVLRKLLKIWRIEFLKLIGEELYYFLTIYFAVKKLKTKFNFDIIHGQDPSSTYAAKLAINGKVITTITTCHYNDNPVKERELHYKLSNKQIKLIERWFRFLFLQNKNYVFVSYYGYLKSKYLFTYKINKKIIHNGVSFSSFKKHEPCNSSFYISNVGTLEPRKNQLLLLKAASFLKKWKFDFKIFLYGDGPKKIEWENYVKENDLEGYVLFEGFKRNVIEKVAETDLYIHTSLNESCSIAIIETFSVGVPVMALSTGGTPELFPKSNIGLLASDITPEELAKEIVSYAQNTHLKEKYIEQYMNAFEKFNIHRMVSETISFYKYCRDNINEEFINSKKEMDTIL